MLHTVALIATLILLGLPAEAASDEPDRPPLTLRAIDAAESDVRPEAPDRHDPRHPPAAERSLGERPAALVPLYASFAALQGADLVLTRRAIARGATEANPVMRGVVGSPAGFFAAKAGLTATTILFTEKLRKRHPKAAVVLLVALDAALAVVVTHNARLVHSLSHSR
jgi:hypothetical protein